VKLLKEKFVNYYIQVLVFFSIISLLIFIPIFLFPSLLENIINATPSFLSYQYELWGFLVNQKTLVFYNLLQEEGDRLRNCGPFWERGAFGGFLIIGTLFNSVRLGNLTNKINWLFYITIISTQSTTAYIALFVFILSYLLFQNYSYISKSLVIFFGIAGVFAFQQIPFLGDKIINENNEAQEAIEIKGGDTRIASAILDWNDIKRYPFTGRGIWPETRIDKIYEFVIRNNGFTNFLAEWGFLFFTFYFYYYYKGIKYYCEMHNTNRFIPFAFLLIIWLISSSENYFSLPVFWAFLFLYLPLQEYYSDKPPSMQYIED
jgi:hypothetical protein